VRRKRASATSCHLARVTFYTGTAKKKPAPKSGVYGKRRSKRREGKVLTRVCSVGGGGGECAGGLLPLKKSGRGG